jgi:hypothetical protein
MHMSREPLTTTILITPTTTATTIGTTTINIIASSTEYAQSPKPKTGVSSYFVQCDSASAFVVR